MPNKLGNYNVVCRFIGKKVHRAEQEITKFFTGIPFNTPEAIDSSLISEKPLEKALLSFRLETNLVIIPISLTGSP